MKWKMLFRLGLTIVIVVAIVLFYLNNVLHKNNKDKISQLVRSDNLAFKDAVVIGHGNGDHGRPIPVNGEAVKREWKWNQNAAVNGAENMNDKYKDKREDKIDDLLLDEENDAKNGGKVFDSSHNDEEVAGDVADDGGIKERVPPVPAGGQHDAVVHMESAGNGVTAGLQPVRRRVGKQVPMQVHVIHLSLVVCGDRGPEVMVLLKSAVTLTTSTPLIVHIFADRELHDFLTDQFTLWPGEVLDRVEYRLYDITFPASENAEEWRKVFKPCATQRLFIPSLLLDVDALIYVDTDVLFLSPLTKLWSFFSRFNSTQLVAMTPESEDSSTGWYNRFARHPYVPPLGVNSGVMLMNLTRLRQSTWLSSVVKFYKEYRLKLTWGDQDLINIYLHYHPEQLYVYPCDWNFRPDHCMYMSVCKTADQHGAFIIHGSRRVMHNDKQPAFKAVYNAFKNYRLGQDVEWVLLENMKKNLQATSQTPCGKHAHIFLKQVQEFVTETRGQSFKGLGH